LVINAEDEGIVRFVRAKQRLAAGGTTGWHTHPGHSLIIVTAGAVTAYEGNDPSCKPTVYTVGMGFVDPGGGHVHNIRNEGRRSSHNYRRPTHSSRCTAPY
jgi:hypothetical protein